MKYTLYLCHAVGEVLTMLSFYKRYRATNYQLADPATGVEDLSFVHSYLDQSEWEKLYRKLKKKGVPGLEFIWVKYM